MQPPQTGLMSARAGKCEDTFYNRMKFTEQGGATKASPSFLAQEGEPVREETAW